MLCNDLEGLDGGGVGMGERFREQRLCIHVADSLHCTAETNKKLYSNYTPIKNLIKSKIKPISWNYEDNIYLREEI